MMRPVRNWKDPTSVQLDVVVYGILDLVGVFTALWESCMNEDGISSTDVALTLCIYWPYNVEHFHFTPFYFDIVS